jgi:STE24 endopeptidase
MRRLLLGFAGGFVLGYTALRTLEAARDLRSPRSPLEANPQAYGAQRRGLMVAGLARSTAALAVIAFELAPRTEGAEQGRRRLRRIALLTGGMVASAVLDLPIDYTEGHLLERRYGLTHQARGAWLADRGKQLAVSIVILVPLVELLCWVIDLTPRLWTLVAAAGVAPLLVLANLVAPTYIAPLFNQFEALEGPLTERLRTLAGRYGVGDATILRMDMSRQTTKANAYVTGLFKTHRIVIGDTLLGGFSEDEITFVVAHELGHYVHRDTWRLIALGTLTTAATLFISRALAQRGDAPLSSVAGLARLFFYATISSLGLLPLSTAVARNRERAADRFAITATRDPASGVAAFERLREKNLAEDEQPRWMELIFSSHPSLRSRIERLRSIRDLNAT